MSESLYRENYLLRRYESKKDDEIERLQSALKEANEDAERLADELKIVLLKTGVVWEEAGESSPALIIHRQRIGKEGEG